MKRAHPASGHARVVRESHFDLGCRPRYCTHRGCTLAKGCHWCRRSLGRSTQEPMNTKPWIEIQQAHLQYGGRLAIPSISLVNDTQVADRLLAQLGPYGAQPDGLVLTVSSQNLAESSLAMSFLGGYATLKLSPLGVEISLQGSGDGQINVPLILPQEVLSDLLSKVGTSIGSAAEQPNFATHTFTLTFHAKLHGQGVVDLLDSYVRAAPEAFGELAGAGVRYIFKASGARRNSWLLAEPSMSIQPDGLYVTCAVEFDGAQVSTDKAADSARDYLRSIVESPDFPVGIGND